MFTKFRTLFTGIGILALALAICLPGPAAAAEKEPVVIGYVGNVDSPGTKPSMDIQKMAVEEINNAGGINGRPIKYIIANGKGDTTASVDAARRLLMENNADFIFVEGRSEICLAVQESTASLYKDHPHILIFNGPMDSELTARVLRNYEKYKHCFRDWDPEASHYAQMNYYFGNLYKDLGWEKMAILWEDLAWTSDWQEGAETEYMELPPWEKLAEQNGIEVVYTKAVKPRGTMYLPIFQQIARADADMILYVSSWFTDTESFAKQWANSAASDIPINLYGGVAQTHDYWDMTGGKALGAVSSFFEFDFPITEKSQDLIQKAEKENIPLQINGHLAYADIYFIKEVIENAGGTANMDKVIRMMETTEMTYSLGIMAYETKPVAPFFHSKIRVDPDDPIHTTYDGSFYQPMVQFQNDGEMAYIGPSCKEHEDDMAPYVDIENYKTPAELRQMR
ncbi:MAG: ABC transporter substrate-binding protein [Desulfobacteraceae bacterium]|nr:ABC transporter substrate-binding protein [Desulfobacteraceae bacterium]